METSGAFLFRRGDSMSDFEEKEKVRVIRAMRGLSPCKKPYCTGERCYRRPFICRAWDIYNQRRKSIGR